MLAGFEIRPATPEEAPALALINRIAFNDVATWDLLFKDVDTDDVTKLLLAITAKRMADGNVTYVSAVDKETGYAERISMNQDSVMADRKYQYHCRCHGRVCANKAKGHTAQTRNAVRNQ